MRAIIFFFALLAILLPALPTSAVAPEPGPVWDTWARTDLPVSDGIASRTWMWGPEAISDPMIESYVESPDGLRPVQYFEKSRMEITDPAGDIASPWYVTNGLLVVEMVTGQVQIGDADFEQRDPASINAAGDSDDPNGPTYTTIAMLLDLPASPPGTVVDQRVNRDGAVTTSPELGSQNVTIAIVDDVTDHGIAQPFWILMNSIGPVYEDGGFVTGQLFENPYFATGRPITEPYWAEVKVAGTVKWVLIQAFERRILTYTPDNPAGWQVEAGNVGSHYFDWRYNQQPPMPPGAGETITIDVEGLEIDAGDTQGNTTYGLRFIGLATGDVAGAMEVELDYSPPNPGPNAVNQIVGGSWSISSEGGELSGDITAGSATWNGTVTTAAIEATFGITTATGQFGGYAGTGAFTGTLSHLTFPPRISGVLMFDLEPDASTANAEESAK